MVQMITDEQSQSLRSYEVYEIDSDTEQNDPVVAAQPMFDENGEAVARMIVTKSVFYYLSSGMQREYCFEFTHSFITIIVCIRRQHFKSSALMGVVLAGLSRAP